MSETKAALDRVAGVLVGLACGDALGAGYEFGPPLDEGVPVLMDGGGIFGWEPGEWTDDTSMAIAIAEIAANGADLRAQDAQDGIVRRWLEWSGEARDVGIQTSAVLHAAAHDATARAAAVAATEFHRREGRSGGNGSLMRTAPVTLAFLHDPDAMAATARALSALTHYDPEAGDACVLWCLAIRHAILHAEFELRGGLEWLPEGRRELWRQRIDEAEANPPRHFRNNGWVVGALQGAWSAITTTGVPATNPSAESFGAQHLQLALEAAVRGGGDTDTVAAIAGGLLGARWGVAAVPFTWQRTLHGWPGLRQRDLVRLGLAAYHGEAAAETLDYGYLRTLRTPTLHPHDPRVILGPVNAAAALPSDVDAVVSLCRVDDRYLPPGAIQPSDRIEIWLVDSPDEADNPHLHFVMDQAATAVETLTAEGRTVFLHCAAGQSRTPAIAALIGARRQGIPTSQALREVLAALPDANMKPFFAEALTVFDTRRSR